MSLRRRLPPAKPPIGVIGPFPPEIHFSRMRSTLLRTGRNLLRVLIYFRITLIEWCSRLDDPHSPLNNSRSPLHDPFSGLHDLCSPLDDLCSPLDDLCSGLDDLCSGLDDLFRGPDDLFSRPDHANWCGPA